MITRLKPGQVFVFGSNLAGRHGLGAAKIARERFGAQPGVGRGPTGRCYAVPTKDANLHTLPLARLVSELDALGRYARSQPKAEFLVTAVGCGLAGYAYADVLPYLQLLPPNCTLIPPLEDSHA